METGDYFRRIDLDRTSAVPLKAQLEQALGTLFARLAPGSTIPPEREIAEMLQISRVTVRSALQKFFDEGMIERQRRVGTKIAAHPRQRPLAFNPLSLGPGFAAPPKYTLRFLLFEDLPNLKEYWTKIAAEFNRTRHNAQVELIYLAPDEDVRNIEQIIQKQAIDILMVADTMPQNIRNQLLELPESIQEKYRSPEYLFKEMLPDAENSLRYMLPIRLVFPQIYWNEDLAKTLNLPDLRQRIAQEADWQWLIDAAERLSGDMTACSHLWDCFGMANLPELIQNPARLEKGLQELADWGKRSGKASDKLFFAQQNYPLDFVERFVNGEQLTLLAYPHTIHCFPPPAFPMGVLPFPKAASGRLTVYCINLALTKNLISAAPAEDFLNFLLSPEIQRLGGKLCEDCPVRKREAIAFLAQTYRMESKQAEAVLKRLYFVAENNNINDFYAFIVHVFRKKFFDVLSGALPVKSAAEEFERRFMNYQKQMNG